MAAYMIARVEVHDMAQYKEYTAVSPGAIEAFGGRFLARGGRTETMEGPEETRRVVVIEFPDFETARTFYHSDEYQAAKAKREGAADGQFVLVDGA